MNPIIRWLPTALFAGALGITLVLHPSLRDPAPIQPDFANPLESVTPLRAVAARLPAGFVWSDLPRPTPSAHAATLTEVLPAEGAPEAPTRLMAAWFGGTREGAADVSLYQSDLVVGHAWQPATELMTRQSVQAQMGRNIRKLGNPLLMAEPGRLHLYFVSVSYGGWAGSAINRSLSTNGGQS